MKKLLSFFFAAILFAFATGAHAATYSSLTLSDQVVAGNVDLADVTLGAHSAIVTGDASTHVLSKEYTTTGEYLSVYGGGNATYSLTGAALPTVSFNWGTIDAYNKIIVTNANNDSYAITGQDILNLATTFGLSLAQGGSSVYVTLTDLVGIMSVQFLSTSNSFEVADISAVPLPGALVLFGSAVAGAAAYRRRRNGGAGSVSA